MAKKVGAKLEDVGGLRLGNFPAESVDFFEIGGRKRHAGARSRWRCSEGGGRTAASMSTPDVGWFDFEWETTIST